VLTGDADKGLEPVGLLLKCFHQRGYFDGLGTGAETSITRFLFITILFRL